MPLSFVTGLPGHGKTLFTLHHVDQRAKQENRAVYVAGIPELKLDWFHLDNEQEWFSVPDGSIVVIDEAQRVFPTRPTGAPVPEKVRQFETHRHRGLDIYLITQDAMLIDAHVRRLAGEHFHVHRPWGVQRATVLKWDQICNPRDYHDRKKAIQSMFSYPKKLFGQYKSATLHTVKRKVPAKLFLLPVLLVVLVVSLYFAFSTLRGMVQTEKKNPAVQKDQLQQQQQQSNLVQARHTQPESLQDYMQRNNPRVRGFLHTAPVYDEITKPVRAPYPAACVDLGKRGCRCYTQQGTRLDTPADVCLQVVKDGFFIAWDNEPRRQAAVDQERPLQARE